MIWTHRSTAAIAASVAVVALAASCGSSSKPSASPATAPLPVPPTTMSSAIPKGAVVVGNGQVPATPVSAPLRQTYRSKHGRFDASQFRIAPGSVTAAWYRMGDAWAVYYRGLTQLKGAGKCPGTSLKTPSGLQYASNTPYGSGTCAGFTDQILSPGSLFRCSDKAIIYKTQIPFRANGALNASLEQGLSDGSMQGMTSQVPANAAGVPQIAPNGCFVVY